MKNKKWLFVLGIVAGVLIGAYFVAGYFLGNLPIASDLLGTNKQRDLGIEISVASANTGLIALNKPTTNDDSRWIDTYRKCFID